MAKFTRSIFTTATKIARGILTGIQSLFNTNVKTGKYDLQKLIEDSPWYHYTGINQDARRWLADYKKRHDVRYDKKFLEAGKLYYFRYNKPKHYETLEYWDKAPLMLCLGGYWTKDARWIEMGLNLHLLPQKTRCKVLIKIFNMYSQKYRGEMYSASQRPLELNWAKVAEPLMIYGAGFAFRSYIPTLRTETIEFKYEDWDKAIFAPNEYLNKTSERELADKWKKYLMDKSWRTLSADRIDKLFGGKH